MNVQVNLAGCELTCISKQLSSVEIFGNMGMDAIKKTVNLMAIAAMTACGGGSSTSLTSNNAATYTGQYIDAPTKGLVYAASPSGLSGVTDSNGNFSFRANDRVSFKIQTPSGTIDAGTVSPSTPPDTTTAAVISVLNIPNGIAIAQTLQSLGGTGSLIDVSASSANVSALSAAETSAISSFIASGGATSKPAKITVASSDALDSASKALANVTTTSFDASLLKGLTVFNTYSGGLDPITPPNTLVAKGLGAGFGYFEASGKLYNLCSYQPPIQLSGVLWSSCDSTIPIGGLQGTWSISTNSSGVTQIVEPITAGSQSGATNTVSPINVSLTSGSFNNKITGSPTLPPGRTQSGTGIYTVLQSTFGISTLAGKTIVVAGDGNCADGKMKYVVNTAGSSYTKLCNTSSVAGSSFVSTTGALANLANWPGIVTFTDAGATPEKVLYVGISSGSSVASGGTGSAAVMTIGSSASCNLTTKSSCGIAGLFSYSVL